MASQRQQIRKALRSLVAVGVPAFKIVHDHETKDLNQKSPLAMIYSDGTSPYEDRDENRYAFIISIWVKRIGDGDTTEDDIDDLSEAVIDLVMSGGPGILSSLRIDDAYNAFNFSTMDYPDPKGTDGVQYRRERIRVIV